MTIDRRLVLAGLLTLTAGGLAAAQTNPPPRPSQPLNIAPGAAPPAGAQPAAPGTPLRPPRIAAKAGQPLDTTQRALVERVNAWFNSMQFMTGDFVQVGPDGTRFGGKMYVQKPGRMRFQYDAPSNIELIADGQAVAVRDRKLVTQDIYPIGQTPLRFLLSEQLNLLRDTSVIGVHRDDLYATVVLEERNAIGGTHRVLLMFNATDLTLRQWTITDPQGFDTTVVVSNLDNSRRPDAKLFRINYERMLQ
jgi:outer membrane lipoprotein-sorting protein